MSTYANTSTDRPSQAKPGGRGIYCCIPQCDSSQYDNQKNKTNIALFSFPNKEKNPDIYNSWCQEIHKLRIKGGKDAFKITKGTPEELNASENTCLCENCIELQIQINYLQSKIDNLISENIELKSENDNLKIINKDFSNRMFTYENLSKDEEKFRSATGIEVEKLNILHNYLEPDEFCENIKFYNKNQANVDEKISANTFASPSFFSPESKPGPKPKLKAIDQLFIYLT